MDPENKKTRSRPQNRKLRRCTRAGVLFKEMEYFSKISKSSQHTLRILGVIELGPLEEKVATVGAGVFPIMVLVGFICTAGNLHIWSRIYACQKPFPLFVITLII